MKVVSFISCSLLFVIVHILTSKQAKNNFYHHDKKLKFDFINKCFLLINLYQSEQSLCLHRIKTTKFALLPLNFVFLFCR